MAKQPKRPKRRGFGSISELGPKRFRARYTDPEGRKAPNGEPLRHNAPHTFDTQMDAEAWLVAERRLISSGDWTSPASRAAAKKAGTERLTFGTYAEAWLRDRPLKPRTRSHYRALLDRHLMPAFGGVALTAIFSPDIRQWHATTATHAPTARAHAYGLLHAILSQAERDELIVRNPANIRAASSAPRVHKVRPLTLDELEVLAAAMPEERRLMVYLALWCALRFGELAELRVKDIDLKAGVVKVRRAVVRVDGTTVVGSPKSEAGLRDVAIPPHLLPTIKEHLDTLAGREALLFPGGGGAALAPSTLYGRAPTKTSPGHGFYAARAAAGRPDLRFHDLRHSGAVLAAQEGATLAELMNRLGHSTPAAALRYQHAAQGRDRELALRLSERAKRGV